MYLLRVSLILMVMGGALGALWEGQVGTKEHFYFLDRFCFDSTVLGKEPGLIDIDIGPIPGKPAPLSSVDLKFAVFPAELWRQMYDNRDKLTCQQKLALASNNSIRSIPAGGLKDEQRVVEHLNKFWYFTLFACGANGNFWQIAYSVNATNPPHDDWWLTNFSYDEFGVLQMTVFFLCAYALIFAVHGYGVLLLRRKDNYKPVIRLFSGLLLAQTTFMFMKFIHYASFASNGVGAPALLGLAELIDMCVQACFIAYLLLLSQGWGISSSLIERPRMLAGAFGGLMFLFFVLFLWQYTGLDRASTLYFYESFPGWMILLLRVVLGVVFVAKLRITVSLESSPVKSKFYMVMGALMALWFFMLTLVVLIAYGMPDSSRFKTVDAVYSVTNMIAFASFACFFWPSWADNYFQILRQDINEGGAATKSTGYGTYEAL